MKSSVVQKSIAPLTVALIAALPIGNSFHAAHASTLAAMPAAAQSKTFKGSVEQMQQWGAIRVSILVKSKKLTKVNVAADYHTGRSQSIQSQAIPILKQETLKAQSANINTVSGATDTSDAYITSLQNAIKAARHAKALK